MSSEDESLSERVEIRCTAEEKQRWREFAKRNFSGKNVLSPWARAILNDATKPKQKKQSR